MKIKIYINTKYDKILMNEIEENKKKSKQIKSNHKNKGYNWNKKKIEDNF